MWLFTLIKCWVSFLYPTYAPTQDERVYNLLCSWVEPFSGETQHSDDDSTLLLIEIIRHYTAHCRLKYKKSAKLPIITRSATMTALLLFTFYLYFVISLA